MRSWLKLSCLLMFLVALLVAAGFVLDYVDKDLRTAYAIIGSAFLATVGWLFQHHYSLNNRRKEYTLAKIEEFRSNLPYMRHKYNILRYYPGREVLKEKELKELHRVFFDKSSYIPSDGAEIIISNLPVLLSMREILNFYEEISYGIRHGEMDEKTIKNTLSGIMVQFFRKSENLVKLWWRGDKEHFEHFRWLINKWNWELKGKDRDNSSSFVSVRPRCWSNSVWSEDGTNLKWGAEGMEPWGGEDVESSMRQED